MKKSFILPLICLFALGNVNAQFIYGLDPTFANNGIYVGDTGSFAQLVVQPDNKILAIGQSIRNGTYTHVVKRFNGNGTIDNSFANNGEFLPILPSIYTPFISCGALQPDGKILLGKGLGSDLLLIRLKADGSFDSSFGNDGFAVTDLGGHEFIRSIVVQPDGKIVICGGIQLFDHHLLIARYLSDGTLDSGFGDNGSVISDFTTWGFPSLGYPEANDLALMPDGRIVVGADAYINALGGVNAFTAVRLLTDGSLDTSFNHTGIAYTNSNLPGLLYCKTMCLKPDGRILLGGYADSIAIVQFDISGQLDNSFGINGLIKLNPAGKVAKMLLQPDGKIILGTNPDAFPFPDTCYTIYRLYPNGSPDNSFGLNAKVLTKVANASTSVWTMVLQPDGKLLASGTYLSGSSTGILTMVRYTPNATTSVSDNSLGKQITLFPNPTSDYIFINTDSNIAIRDAHLYSIDGTLLRIYNITGTKQLSTDGLSNGVYYLRLNLNNYHLIKKVIIQKN